jgi:hypothetical protein
MLETACAADRAGQPVSDWTVFVTHQGGLQLVAGAEEPLVALRAARGARIAWRVRRERGLLCVEGEGEGARCRLETAAAGRAAARLLSSTRMYSC